MSNNAVARQFPIARVGRYAGLALAAIILTLGAPEALAGGRHVSPAWITLALFALMAVWWVTEAVPIPVTSLLPLIVLPLTGVSSFAETAAPYMHPIVVLLLGGFMFAKAIEAWGLHERIALHVVARAGGTPAALVGGFMAAAALLSMWVSNSATAIMMTPIALSVAAALENQGQDGIVQLRYALLLGIAYACSIGGLGTPIGTPTNLIVIGYINDRLGIDLGFVQWMLLGIPVVLTMVPLAWWSLTRWSFRMPVLDAERALGEVRRRLRAQGRMSTPEKRTVIVFALVAFLWALRRPLNAIGITIGDSQVHPLTGLGDGMIAIIGVLMCFLVPAGADANRETRLLTWQRAEQIPWGVLLLFGGGMTLAKAISDTGLSAYLGQTLAIVADLPLPVLLLLITVVVLALTEVTSNIATASALMPVLGAVAIETGLPLNIIGAPVALAASCAFMLPMATGPNAVAFGTNEVPLSTMARAGIRINLVAVVVIVLGAYFVAPVALGVT